MRRSRGFGRVLRFLGIILSVLTIAILFPQGDMTVQAAGPAPFVRPPAFKNLDPPKPPKQPPAPQKNTATVSPDQDAVVKSPSGKASLNIPKGAAGAAMQVEFSEYAPSPSSGMVMLNLFDFNATQVGSGKKITSFSKGLTLTIQHTEEELEGINVGSLKLYYLDEKTHSWVPAESTYDPKRMVLTATITHFSEYGEQADPTIVGPGRILAAQVSMYSGAATFNYPLELPPGPGGFRPKLELTYNSGSIDGMKNKKSVGSWVGIGWDLKLGNITYGGGKCYLNLNGGSYELMNVDNLQTPEYEYVTTPDEFYKLKCSPYSVWEATDKDGNFYQFGGTVDSKQNSMPRWDLNLMRDVNGNQATIAYVKDMPVSEQFVRAAYPEYLTYGNIEVHFISSWDENDATEGHLRLDNPKATYGHPAPQVMDTRHLDAIEIKAGGTLVRKYTFSYNTVARVQSTDYGGTYYAGKLTLSSITEKGADGTSALPTMTFTYQDKQIFRQSAQGQYTGNPGNPASLYWPYLTQISSGYGGSVAFEYTQAPGTSYFDIWTREVVTAKAINSGIEPAEVRYYTYSGSPAYYKTDWEQEFRGFSEVTETDAVGNYIEHYFYTTGTLNGQDADKLTGREYDTKYYNPSAALQKETANGWVWNQIAYDYYPARLAITYTPSGGLGQVAASADGNFIYIANDNTENGIVTKYDSEGTAVATWTCGRNPTGISVSPNGTVYVSSGTWVSAFDANGTFLRQWNCYYGILGISSPTDDYVYVMKSQPYTYRKYTSLGSFVSERDISTTIPTHIAVANGIVYTTLYNSTLVYKYNESNGYYLGSIDVGWSYRNPSGIAAVNSSVYVAGPNGGVTDGVNSYGGTSGSTTVAAAPNGDIYIVGPDMYYANTACEYRTRFFNGTITLTQVDEITGAKTNRTRYSYDSYGNVVTEYHDGDTSVGTDDFTAWRYYVPNTTANIVSKPARERTYQGLATADNPATFTLKQETRNYYDSAASYTTAPVKGNLTRQDSYKDASTYVSNYYTYDSYGNMRTSQDGNGNTTTWNYYSGGAYLGSKVYPITGISESYSWDVGTDNMLTKTGINGQTTTYQYDTFKRLTKVIKPGDTAENPTTEYRYNNWGTLGQQNLETRTKIADGNYLWQKQYFDGLGRVIQVQANGETGYTVLSSTATFNNRGLADKQYVSQVYLSTEVSGYKAPEAAWKYTTYAYDALGRVLTQTNADGTTESHDYATAWQELVTNARGYKTRYYYDAYQELVKVEELNDLDQVYATTNYTYDVLKNLTQVRDNANNTTTMTYDWLSRKTAMTDPDMGSWQYTYDNNGNLINQRDAKNYNLPFSYDALNRMTMKGYPNTPQTITLRPNGSYSSSGLYPSSGIPTDWECVDEAQADGWDSFLAPAWGGQGAGLYSIQTTTASGTISNVSITGVVHYDGTSPLSSYGAFTLNCQTGTSPTSYGSQNNIEPGAWYTVTRSMSTSPFTGSAWTWNEINSLRIGETLGCGRYVAWNEEYQDWITYVAYSVFTQIYVTVTYLPDVPPPVTYSYDSTTGGNYGKGQRTGMTDASGTTAYKYDNRGRIIEEKRTIDGVDYTTTTTYDGAGRIATVTLPTGEVVTSAYNGRGLPDTLSGTAAGDLVTSTLYNQLGQITEINLGNTLRSTFGYYGLGGAYDTTGNYYGKLWEIKTLPQGGGTAIQDVRYVWDANGNMLGREDALVPEVETFTYDFLDRLTAASGAYTQSYAYNQIGNITSMNGTAYTYGAKPHAVTAVGATSYVYDANGNMTTRGAQTITWDTENRPLTVTGGASFVYDGNGNRVKKTEGGETTLYVNKYYEKNLTTSTITTSYYLGDRLVAQREGTTLRYIHQDSLSSSSAMSSSTGTLISSIKYFPFGATRSGSVSTDKKFTGQRLDGTGLYYYGARYYDPTIGRFISPDPLVQQTPQAGSRVIEALTASTSSPKPHITQIQDKDDPIRYINPQEHNRYSYVLNDPLKYFDPIGSFAFAVALIPFMFNPTVLLIGGALCAIYVGYQIAKAIKDNSKSKEKDKNKDKPRDNDKIRDLNDPGDKIAQKGGNKISKAAGDAIRDFTGNDATDKEIGDALERLKNQMGRSGDDHGTITVDGSFYDSAGRYVGNILDYLW